MSFRNSGIINTAVNGTINYATAQRQEQITFDELDSNLQDIVKRIELYNIGGSDSDTEPGTGDEEKEFEVPMISIQNVTKNSFTIKVENNYPEGKITEYKYYIGEDIISEGTTNTSYEVTGLEIGEEYKDIKVEAYTEEEVKESEKKRVITYDYEIIDENGVIDLHRGTYTGELSYLEMADEGVIVNSVSRMGR